MRFSLPSRLFSRPDSTGHLLFAAGETQPDPRVVSSEVETVESTIFRTLALVSAGIGALALGLVVGREIRLRYKFNRRTPYDFYAHAGDEQDMEFGVGI